MPLGPLEGAVFDGADLSGVDCKGAHLEGASLLDARLQGANLDKAELQRAFLVNAQLQGASLDLAYLQGTYLQGASLQLAQLKCSYMHDPLNQLSQPEVSHQGCGRIQDVGVKFAKLQIPLLKGAQLRRAIPQTTELDSSLDKISARLVDPFFAVSDRKLGPGHLPQLCLKPSHESTCIYPMTGEETLVLGVTVPGAPFKENAERRRRARYAVLAGLERSGFVPKDVRHIDYFVWGALVVPLSTPVRTTSVDPVLKTAWSPPPSPKTLNSASCHWLPRSGK